jgi:hypothetical protein
MRRSISLRFIGSVEDPSEILIEKGDPGTTRSKNTTELGLVMMGKPGNPLVLDGKLVGVAIMRKIPSDEYFRGVFWAASDNMDIGAAFDFDLVEVHWFDLSWWLNLMRSRCEMRGRVASA